MAVPITEARLDEVARLIASGQPIVAACREVGINNSTLFMRYGTAEGIRLWATQRATPEVREQATIRERVARAIAEKGPFESVGDIRDAIAAPRELIVFQSVVGAVWSLQKQGEVAFTQSSSTHMTNGHGAPDGGLKNIRALPGLYRRLGLPEPRKGNGSEAITKGVVGAVRANLRLQQPMPKHPADQTDFRTHSMVAVGGPIEVIPAPEPLHQNEKPEPPEYPLLVGIRAKAARVAKAREAVKLIEQAADLVSTDERSRLLDEGARLVADHDLLPVEEEYLKYAEAHS